MTDAVLAQLTADPATAYRELLYRPTGTLASMIDREFAVVARPGRVPDSDLRRGDVLLEVELGRPGYGRCALLDESAVETVIHGRRLPRGRVVLRSRAATQLRRQQPVEPEPPDEPEPGVVDPGDAEFIGTEHKSIGDDGSGHLVTTILYGDPPQALTFGDVVSLAGDYFGSFEELRRLGDTPAGRLELAWTRWDCLGNRGPAPQVPQSVKDRVMDRYYDLAANNVTHFLWGGTSQPTYAQWHGQALVDAFEAGQLGDDSRWQRALAKEAFGDHFLTDSFAGGHVRTPPPGDPHRLRGHDRRVGAIRRVPRRLHDRPPAHDTAWPNRALRPARGGRGSDRVAGPAHGRPCARVLLPRRHRLPGPA